jgi:hypothetical protein
MGQDLRRACAVASRIEIKQVFLKLSGVGKENSFSVSTQRRAGKADEFTEASFEIRKYEEKYLEPTPATSTTESRLAITRRRAPPFGETACLPGGFRSPSSLLCSASGTCGACSRGTSWSRPRRLLSWPLSLAGRACTVSAPSTPAAAVVLPARSSGFVAAAPAAPPPIP